MRAAVTAYAFGNEERLSESRKKNRCWSALKPLVA